MAPLEEASCMGGFKTLDGHPALVKTTLTSFSGLPWTGGIMALQIFGSDTLSFRTSAASYTAYVVVPSTSSKPLSVAEDAPLPVDAVGNYVLVVSNSTGKALSVQLSVNDEPKPRYDTGSVRSPATVYYRVNT
jgi:hypothetical protein